MGCSERQKEIKRRRHRRQKLQKLKTRVARASASEKTEICKKLRELTPGAEQIIRDHELEAE